MQASQQGAIQQARATWTYSSDMMHSLFMRGRLNIPEVLILLVNRFLLHWFPLFVPLDTLTLSNGIFALLSFNELLKGLISRYFP